MPPRYSYWTIIAGGLPTAFRAAEREELMPTFTRLREKHPDAEMRWFARGKLWDSPDAARRELDTRRPEGEGRPRRRTDGRPAPADGPARNRDWRPGGEHRDPRQKYADAKKTRNVERRKQKFARKHGDDRPARGGDGRGAAPPDRPPAEREGAKRFGDRPRRPLGPQGAQGDARGDQRRGWGDRAPRGDARPGAPKARPSGGAGPRPWAKPRDAGAAAGGEQRRGRDDRPARGADTRPGGWKPKPATGAARPWSKPNDGGSRAPQRPGGPERHDRPPRRKWDTRADHGRHEGPPRAKERDRQNTAPRGRETRDGSDRPPRRAEWREPRTDRGPRDAGTRPPDRPWEHRGRGGGQGRFSNQRPGSRGKQPGGWKPRDERDRSGPPQGRPWSGAPDRGGSRARDDREREPARRRFEPPSFERNQGTEEPSTPPRPRGPNREPRPSESPEPTPPPRPSEPVTTPPGPPERGRLVKKPRRP